MKIPLLRAIFLASACALVQGFSFTHGNPTQCDNLQITWTGGQAPYQVLVAPLFGTQRNFSVPATASGTYTVPQLAFTQGSTFLISMSDATGFGTGGTTGILTVGSSTGGTCNTTDPGPNFTYNLDTTLQQCKPFTFNGYDKAVLPVTIYGMIPSGQTFIINTPAATSYQWTANVAANTPVVFALVDAAGNIGGVSHVETVGSTDDTSCLNANSPSVTPNAAVPQTATKSAAHPGTASATSTGSNQNKSTKSSSNLGAIVGGAVGGVILIAGLFILGTCFLRRGDSSGGAGQRGEKFNNQNLRKPSLDNVNYNDPAQRFTRPEPYLVPGTATSASATLLTEGRGSPFRTPPFQGGQYTPDPYPPTPQDRNSYAPSGNSYAPGGAPYAAGNFPYPTGNAPYPTGNTPYPTGNALYAASNAPYSPPGGVPYAAGGASYAPGPASYDQPPPFQRPLSTDQNSNISASQMPSTPPPVSASNASNAAARMSFAGSSTSPSVPAKTKNPARSEAEPQQPARFIVHTDMDEVAQPNADGVIELPPQYSEARTPLVGLPLQGPPSSGAPPQNAAQHHPQPSSGLAYLQE